MLIDLILNRFFAVIYTMIIIAITPLSNFLLFNSEIVGSLTLVAQYAGVINYYVPLDFAWICIQFIGFVWGGISAVSIALKLL